MLYSIASTDRSAKKHNNTHSPVRFSKAVRGGLFFMRHLHMTKLFTIIMLLSSLSATSVVLAQSNSRGSSSSIAFDPEITRLRVMNMDLMFNPTYDADVERYIRANVNNRASSERLLGKTTQYFPYFEQALSKYNLPSALKALPIIESLLNPKAISPAGAGGLWQFMPGTGALYSLKIGGGVDERYDPVLSSDAAAQYLQKLYSIFEDWEVVLAAYNCGPGTVMNAVKKAKSTSYQDIKAFLPNETRQYVPKFVAASYLIQHFNLYEMKPLLPELDVQLTTAFKVFKSLTFRQIEVATGVSQATVAALNPSYKQEFVPASDAGNFVIIPRRVSKEFSTLIQSVESNNTAKYDAAPISMSSSSDSRKYTKSTYIVSKGDDMSRLAEAFGCSAWNIQMWNNLAYSYVYEGQELAIYIPAEDDGRNIQVNSEATPSVAVNRSHPDLPANAIIIPSDEELAETATRIAAQSNAEKLSKAKTNVKPEPKKKVSYKYHTVKKNDTLSEIAEKYNVTVSDIRKLNGLKSKAILKPGAKLKVKVLKK